MNSKTKNIAIAALTVLSVALIGISAEMKVGEHPVISAPASFWTDFLKEWTDWRTFLMLAGVGAMLGGMALIKVKASDAPEAQSSVNSKR